MAGRNLDIIRSSTTEVTAPWLLKEMAPRIASTLDYFLLHLTGPDPSLAVEIIPHLSCGCPAGLVLMLKRKVFCLALTLSFQ